MVGKRLTVQSSKLEAAGHLPNSSHSVGVFLEVSCPSLCGRGGAGMLGGEAPVAPTPPCPLAGYRFSFFIAAQRPELTPCPFMLQRSMPATYSLPLFLYWPAAPSPLPPLPLSLTGCGKKPLCSATVQQPCPCEAVCCPVLRRRRGGVGGGRREPSSKNKPWSFQLR